MLFLVVGTPWKIPRTSRLPLPGRGVAWFGGATWDGRRVMRISVCNWATTERDIELAVASVADVLRERCSSGRC